MGKTMISRAAAACSPCLLSNTNAAPLRQVPLAEDILHDPQNHGRARGRLQLFAPTRPLRTQGASYTRIHDAKQAG